MATPFRDQDAVIARQIERRLTRQIPPVLDGATCKSCVERSSRELAGM